LLLLGRRGKSSASGGMPAGQTTSALGVILLSRMAAWVAIFLVGLVLLVPSALGYGTTYFNDNWCCSNEYHSGYDYWDDNYIWRPVGYTVASWFHNSSGNAGYATNTFNNPFANFGPYGYSQGWCDNYNGNYFFATCRVNNN
jgi:hypothetical protein